MTRMLILSLLATTLLLAGCIQVNQDASPGQGSAPIAPPPAEHNRMTAVEKSQTTVALCPPGGINGVPPRNIYCATKTMWMWGEVDLVELPVALSTFNGAATVDAGPEGRWNVTATLQATGASMDEARARLGDIQFSWSHQDRGVHKLEVEAKTKKGSDTQGLSAALRSTLSPSLLLTIAASTASGDIGVHFDRAKIVSASSASGAIDVACQPEVLSLSTASGTIQARARPTGSGTFTLSSASGRLSLAVPEDEAHGYAADLSTASGKITVALKDGTTSGTQANQKHFETTGLSARAIKTQVVMSTASGDLSLAPL